MSAHAAEVHALDERTEGAVTEFTDIVDEIPSEAEPRKPGEKPKRTRPDIKAKWERFRQEKARAAEQEAGTSSPEPPMVDTVLGLPPAELHAFFREVLDVMIDEAHIQLQWSKPSDMWKLRMTEIHARLALKYLGDRVHALSDEVKFFIYTAIWVGPQVAAHWDAPGMKAIKERVSRVVQFFLRKAKRTGGNSRAKTNGQDYIDVETGGSASASPAN